MEAIGRANIFKIEYLDEMVDVYDLHIEDDHSYHVNSIPVHNSTGCIELNNQRFYYSRSGYKPLPARHYNCRSSTSPIYKNNPEGEDIQTFSEWVQEQEKNQIYKFNEEGEKLFGYQCIGLKTVRYYAEDEEPGKGCYPALGGEFRMALGETRYRLWKDGHLKIQRFTDLHGDDLTLEELKKRNSYAWEQAIQPKTGMRGETAEETILRIESTDYKTENELGFTKSQIEWIINYEPNKYDPEWVYDWIKKARKAIV